MTEALKTGGATSVGAADGVADACGTAGDDAATVEGRWFPGPGTAGPCEQAATHTTVRAARVTNGAQRLTVPG